MRGAALLLSALLSTSLWAEAGSYRVELLVFTHLEAEAEPLEIAQLRSFTEVLDLDAPGLPGEPFAVNAMSPTMEDLWRRLRLSATYRPVLFHAWQQNRVDYHPPVRVHDDEVLAERLHFPGDIAYVDLRQPDMFAAYRIRYHRLDGSAQLRRSRFLHLDVDLELRAVLGLPDAPPADEPLPPPVAEQPTPQALPEPPPGPAQVHRLQQSRPVRTGELHYFDGPYFGLLARVMTIDPD